MSTNYYLRRTNEELSDFHIGKFSCRQFGFHGIKIGGMRNVHVGCGVWMWIDVPVLDLDTSNKWIEFLSNEIKTGGFIYDEYNRQISLDEFEQSVMMKPSEEYKNTFMNTRKKYELDAWIDPEGYCFSGYEFS